MPVITLNYEDLESLTSVDRDTIVEQIPMMGADIERIEDEYIDIEFFPDRPDLYSVEGVARALRGFLNIETGLQDYRLDSSNIEIEKDEDIEHIRPYLACAVIRNVNFNANSIKSLMDLQEDLHWGVGRDRKKVSIGVHDLSNITPPFRYMAADPDTKFIPLDFTEPMSMNQILEKHPKGMKFAYILEGFNEYPIILDADDNVLSFPPIINSTRTQITENTTDLFIDVTGLSESVYVALNVLVTALAERGGSVESVKIIDSDGNEKTLPDLEPLSCELEVSEINSLIGTELSQDEILKQLQRMRYGADIKNNKSIEVKVPPYRADILHNYDIVEDIAIGYGYDNIQPEFPESATFGSAHEVSVTSDNICEIMTGLGYSEVMSFTLSNERVHFDNMCRNRTDDVTYVMHPISEDQTMVRTTILPNLMEILSMNQHRELPQSIFEFGDVVINNKIHRNLAAVSIHPEVNFTDIREIVDAVMRERMVEYEVEESDDPAFIGGRRADILVNGKKVGVMGEIYPQVITNFGLGEPVIGFEMEIMDY
ncbi:phenylalanyl-tRNA synthetase, beta subunit [Methanohalobium evestigatum Z-7303]|uniref:Phenylalanine--tRNA ligase beta subunit n=1 Tax=Methanohalobium evestigatum (strain ATCC BAA-1072 / DSM 3721 / NBRC 107634 / OCM 161 / Z-7303) TaxID=644295 RepID=D7E883_METEZ|nr:phenylalanine--tRNA ligase subunit beta [Methanohalobium evestigatum]ADI73425.1 phenylalanyl-tRNA synthetase, beta subunit [Methanohalobium evestigatum Z-7303]